MNKKYFIAVYTNEVKDYCDERFFHNLYSLSRGEQVFIIDNTSGTDYYIRLNNFFQKNNFDNFNLYHFDVPADPIESRFQRNVSNSVNYLRDIFLSQTDLPYFLIVETDVYCPADLLDKFENSITKLSITDSCWGMIGGLYYEGFHNYDFDTATTTLERTGHCLSGCTVYKRALIEKFPFRYDPQNLAPFPDAIICFDAGNEYSFWNEHLIKCDHLHNPVNGLRVK